MYTYKSIAVVVLLFLVTDLSRSQEIKEPDGDYGTIKAGNTEILYTKRTSLQIDKVRNEAGHWLTEGQLFMTRDKRFYKGSRQLTSEEVYTLFTDKDFRALMNLKPPVHKTFTDSVSSQEIETFAGKATEYRIKDAFVIGSFKPKLAPVQISHSCIENIMIQSLSVSNPLVITDTYINGDLIVSNCNIRGGIVLNNVRVKGKIIIEYSSIYGSFYSTATKAVLIVLLADTIKGGLYSNSDTIKNTISLKEAVISDSVIMDNCFIGDDLLFQNVNIIGNLSVRRSVVNDSFIVENSQIARRSDLNHSRINGCMSYDENSFLSGVNTSNRRYISTIHIFLDIYGSETLLDEFNYQDVRRGILRFDFKELESSDDLKIAITRVEAIYQKYINDYRNSGNKEAVEDTKDALRSWRGEFRANFWDYQDWFFTAYGKNIYGALAGLVLCIIMCMAILRGKERYAGLSTSLLQSHGVKMEESNLVKFAVLLYYSCTVVFRIRWKSEWLTLQGKCTSLWIITIWFVAKYIMVFVIVKSALDVPLIESFISIIT